MTLAPTLPGPRATDRPPVATPSATRYPLERTSRLTIAIALLGSAALHAVIFFGFPHPQKKARPVVKDDAMVIMLAPPALKELEEPEPAPNDADAKPDPGTLVPMQQDVPQIARPSDFVQVLDFASLQPPPDYSAVKIFTIPEHISRGTKIGEGIVVFNIADLDRIPEPTYQPAPVFPPSLKREVSQATVKVEFIVDTEGRVMNAFVVESTHPGFDEAAATGVSKWRFKAGFKAGRKVNTRMQVPIIFRLNEADI